MLAIQPAVETAAVQLVKQNSALAEQFLTDYSVSHVHIVVQRWQELARYIIAKYNDGYVQEQPGRPAEKGYPESWLRRVLKERPQQFKLRENIDKIQESKLVD